MYRSLLKWFLFFVVISRTQGGLQELWKSKNYVVNHRIMKIILDSCYENDSVSNPTLIFGEFRESVDEASTIRLTEFFPLDVKKDYFSNRTSYRATKIILIEDSPEQLASDLNLLSRTRWWNPMASFFIIGKDDNTCQNAWGMLRVSWRMNILNSICICTRLGRTELVTFNPVADYAPSPWERVEGLKYFNLFYQYFDSEISCENLHYDKTRIIHGYEIKFVAQGFNIFIPGEYSLGETLSEVSNALTWRLLHCVAESLNATDKVVMVKDTNTLLHSLDNASTDISADTFIPSFIPGQIIVNPEWKEMVAVIKLGREVSTLTKIHQLWATPVLIVAAVAIGILLIVLTVLNHDFPLALLDLTRLLTYTTTLTNNRSHKFRIYFATMLIFMVISNGVFEGSIAAFLTTQERESPVGTIEELIKLKYKFYSLYGQSGMNKYVCPNCDVEETFQYDCIELVMNSSGHACLIYKENYEEFHILRPLDYVRNSKMTRNDFFITRQNYPLRDRIQKTIQKIFESGVMEMWKNQLTHRNENIRKAMEAEWSSPQYKPIRLYKLMFAFQVLALGLSISTIVFFLELLVAKCGEFCKIK